MKLFLALLVFAVVVVLVNMVLQTPGATQGTPGLKVNPGQGGV